MNKLSTAKRTQVIAALVEGAGVNSVSRMTGVGKPTILRLLANLGKACREYQDKTLRNLICKRIQVDEIWSFCHSKDRNLPEELKGEFGYGSVWTWMAIAHKTNNLLILTWIGVVNWNRRTTKKNGLLKQRVFQFVISQCGLPRL